MHTPPRILDLFAGPGGWSEGIRTHLGLNDIGIEWDAAACQTRAAARHTTVRADIARIATEPMRGKIQGKISSPPCQAFSRAGKRLGLVDLPLLHQAVHDLAHGRDTRTQLLAACKDPRSLLAAEPMRFLHDLRPEWTVMEEVPDVLPLWQQYAAVLRGWGYSVWVGILNAADYGVPQTRRRAILIASRVRDIQPPPPTHSQTADQADLFGEYRQPWVSMAEALGWEDGLVVNTRGERRTPGGNEFPADEPSQTLVKSARSWVLRTGNNSMKHSRTGSRRGEGGVVAYERSIGEPAPTLDTRVGTKWKLHSPAATVCATGRIAPHGHRNRDAGGESQFAGPDTVRITVAEAAILQSFPADYPWAGSNTKQFEQVGNAMPPLLAAHIVSAATGLPMLTAAALQPAGAAA